MKQLYSRRKFLREAAAVSLLGGVWPFGSPAQPALVSSGKFSLAKLHEEAAERARALVGGNRITLSLLLPHGCMGNVKPVAERFSQMTNIGIRFREVPVDDIVNHLLLETLSRQSTDIALPATFGIPDLVEAGAILDLDGFAAAYEPVDFRDNVLYSVGDFYKGRFYVYQTDGDTYLMFYHREWLEDPDEGKRFADRFGRELALPKTWKELDELLVFFHRPEQERFGGALFRTPDYIVWEWWIRFHAKGVWPLTDELEPQIHGEAGVEALEEMLAASRYLYPQAEVNGLFENWKAYAKGNIFCNIGWGGTQKYLNRPESAMRGRLRFGPTPGGRIDGTLLQVPYFNWGWNYTVAKGCPHPEIAYLFTLFAASPLISTVSVREQSGYFDPFRREHYDDPRIVSTYSAEFLAAHRTSLLRSIPDFYLQRQGDYFDSLRENLILAHQGKLRARPALARTARQWRLITRKAGRENQIEQWRILKSNYPAAIRQALR